MDSPTRSERPKKVPVSVWMATFLFAVMAFVSIVGSFLFAFPEGGLVALLLGPFLIIVGIAYATLVWKLRSGRRTIWLAALVVPVVHSVTLNTVDLVRSGSIPSEDYPFIGIVVLVVILLLLPPTRRFFTDPEMPAPAHGDARGATG